MTLFLLSMVFPTGPIGLLFKIAVVFILAWVIWALVKWWGVTIPEPLRIIGIGVLLLVLLYLLFELVMMLIA